LLVPGVFCLPADWLLVAGYWLLVCFVYPQTGCWPAYRQALLMGTGPPASKLVAVAGHEIAKISDKSHPGN